MIRLEHVVKHYDHTVAVDGLTMEVPKGRVTVLIGPSGCGKTTTLRLINRLIEPTSGRILIDGVDNSTIKPEELRRSIGYAIQSIGLFPHLTVARNISTVPELLHWDKGRTVRRVEELLRLVGLEPGAYAGKYPHELSGGEAQRIGVARALAADPPILLMDEPFGAVDPLNRGRLQAQFLRIQQGLKKTVLLVTHDLDEAIRLADQIAIMNAGRLVQFAPPEAILSAPANKFVHDFVGTDRALKRLSRISIEGFIKPAPTIKIDAPPEEARSALDKRPSAWVASPSGELLGWVDRAGLSEGITVKDVLVPGKAEDISVTAGASLKEAFSRMLGLGFRSLPVTDEKGRLLGEITLRDIEAATAETEANHAPAS